MRHGSNKIDEERVSIDALVQHLKGLDPSTSIVAQEEPEDPPDYWLTVGERRFAVEITSIVKDHGYAARCSELHDAIKTQADSDGSAPGTYAVEVFRCPDIPRRGTKEWKNLVAAAASSIGELVGSVPGSESRILHDATGHIAVSKCSDEGRSVGLLRVPEAKWEEEAKEELSQLLGQAVGKKFESLQKRGVLAVCPDVILVFYDAYGYGTIETAARALSSVKGYDWLHSIFWAASFSDRPNVMYPDSPGREGDFLYSKNRIWRLQAYCL
jgi:hypothetical protein